MRLHFILSLLLLACDHRPVILEPASTSEVSTSSTSSSSTGAPTTGEASGETSSTTGATECVVVADADAAAIAATCAAHPYEQAGCPGNLGKTCEEMLASVASKRGCGEVTLCDYEACMVSLSTSPCGAWPPACEAAFKCTTSSG